MGTKLTGRLEDWSVDGVNSIIWGKIYDDVHKRWYEGKQIHTSYIENVRDMELKEGDIVKTLNSTYLLGKPWEMKNAVV